MSLGVNLNPDKACNFDCVYCSVDRSVPPVVKTVDLGILAAELDSILPLIRDGRIFEIGPLDQAPQALRRFNDVAFSGDGEPTTSVQFAAAISLVTDRLRSFPPEVRVVVISNATVLHQVRVQHALEVAGDRLELWAKLDAGTEEYFRSVDRSGVPFQQILDNLLSAGRRRPLVIQSLFANLHGVGPSGEEIRAWISRLVDLRESGATISRVQVYTTARRTAESWVSALDPQSIDAIVRDAQAQGFSAEGFYAPI